MIGIGMPMAQARMPFMVLTPSMLLGGERARIGAGSAEPHEFAG